jgi:hypothetical protein
MMHLYGKGVTHHWSEWYTPPRIIEAARRAMGSIDLDPASNAVANEVVQATTFYSPEDDGLLHEWKGNVWLNPPYKPASLQRKFLAVLVTYLGTGDVEQAIVLLNNATEVNWFQDFAHRSQAICLVAGRIKFWNEHLKLDGDPILKHPLQGQAIFYLGDAPDVFAREFAGVGLIVRPW